MIKKMDVNIFKENLVCVLEKIAIANNLIVSENWRFRIIPILEKNKPLNTKDDIMRLIVLNEESLEKRGIMVLDQAIAALSCFVPLCPIWIDVKLKETTDKLIIVELYTSLRMRKPTELHNQETGHPPFRAVI